MADTNGPKDAGKKQDDVVTTATKIVDDARNSAAQTRKASAWLASALGAIPALAVFGNLVSGPGEDATWNPWWLMLGVLAAAAGAYIGLRAFANVMAPVRVSEKQLVAEVFDPSRIPGHPYTSMAALVDTEKWYRFVASGRADGLREAKARERVSKELHDAAVAHASDAKARAEVTTKAYDAKVQEYGDNPDPDQEAELEELMELKEAAANEALEAEEATAETKDRWGESIESRTRSEADYESVADQVHGHETLRADALSISAGDKVRAEFDKALGRAAVAVGLVAVGVVLLAWAPQSTSDPEVEIVTLDALTRAGKDKAGCASAEVNALRLGGTDEEPLVLTIPTIDCPVPRYFVFATKDTEVTKHGDMKKAEPQE